MTSDRLASSISPETGPALGELLVAAAAQVFSEVGYDRATVAEIARRAGVTTGAIYSRYRGKADLMADAVSTRIVGQFEQVLPEAPHGGVDLLSSLGGHLLDPVEPSHWLIVEAVVATRRDPELAEMIRRSFEEEEGRIAKAVQQAKDDGHIDRSLSTAAVAQFALAVGMGMTIGRLLERNMPEVDDWNVVIERVLMAAAPNFGGLFEPATDQQGDRS